MKITKHPQILLSLLAVTALLVPALSAQATDTNSNSTNNPPPPPPREHRGGFMDNLTPAEKAQLKAAHDKAIAQDPTLDQKMKAAKESIEVARKAMHDAMLKADPTIGPIFEKMAPPKWGHEPRPQASCSQTNSSGTNSLCTNSPSMHQMKREGHGMHPGFANLTPEERTQVKAAREKAKNDPAVVAAKEAAKSATTPEARRAAGEVFRKAMHDAMLKADPSIEPILEKIHPPVSPGGAPSAGAEEGAPMQPPQS